MFHMLLHLIIRCYSYYYQNQYCCIGQYVYTVASNNTLSPILIRFIPRSFFWLKLKLTIYPVVRPKDETGNRPLSP